MLLASEFRIYYLDSLLDDEIRKFKMKTEGLDAHIGYGAF